MQNSRCKLPRFNHEHGERRKAEAGGVNSKLKMQNSGHVKPCKILRRTRVGWQAELNAGFGQQQLMIGPFIFG